MTKHISDADIKKLMDRLTPEQRGVAQTLAQYKVESGMLKAQNAALIKEHKDLFKIMIVLLQYYKEQGQEDIRIHESQFLRLTNEYRIDRSFDEKRREIVLKLVHIRDPLPKTEVDIDGSIMGN